MSRGEWNCFSLKFSNNFFLQGCVCIGVEPDTKSVADKIVPQTAISRPHGNIQRAVRAPAPADCTKKRCAHKVILGKHFSFAEWLDFVR